MKIRRNAFALFWSLPAAPEIQFHADFVKPLYPTPADAVAGFKAMFPGELVRSVRDSSGRFLAFKGA